MITGFVSPPRMGKTLRLTWLGYNDYKAGHKVFANYPLYFPHIRLNQPQDILDVGFTEMERSSKTFLIQEADKWFDSRRSMRTENVLLSSFTGQSGKRNIDVYWDTQFPTRVDKGLWDITEWLVRAECIYDDDKNPLLFRYDWANVFYPSKSFSEVFPSVLIEDMGLYQLYDSYKATMPLVKKDE